MFRKKEKKKKKTAAIFSQVYGTLPSATGTSSCWDVEVLEGGGRLAYLLPGECAAVGVAIGLVHEEWRGGGGDLWPFPCKSESWGPRM